MSVGFRGELTDLLSQRRQIYCGLRQMTLVDICHIKLHSARSTIRQLYDVADDVLAKPVREAIPFLKQHTPPEAVARLQHSAQAAIDLFDDFVHDSRCWFRVPHFREYAPGGYCWPRVVFIGAASGLRGWVSIRFPLRSITKRAVKRYADRRAAMTPPRAPPALHLIDVTRLSVPRWDPRPKALNMLAKLARPAHAANARRHR